MPERNPSRSGSDDTTDSGVESSPAPNLPPSEQPDAGEPLPGSGSDDQQPAGGSDDSIDPGSSPAPNISPDEQPDAGEPVPSNDPDGGGSGGSGVGGGDDSPDPGSSPAPNLSPDEQPDAGEPLPGNVSDGDGDSIDPGSSPAPNITPEEQRRRAEDIDPERSPAPNITPEEQRRRAATADERVPVGVRRDLSRTAARGTIYEAADFVVEREGDQYVATVPESVQRTERQIDAARALGVDPWEIRAEEAADGGYDLSLEEGGRRELARERAAAGLPDTDADQIELAETEDGGYRVASIETGPGGRTLDVQPDQDVDFDTMRQPTEAFGQTTRTDIGPGGPSQPGPLGALEGGTRSFFSDPYGSTIGYGVNDLTGNFAREADEAETAVSRQLGVDIGRTATVTGETLVDRPIDSVVTGIGTIRVGAAAAASDVSEDTAAAGVLASSTATGTGTAVAGGIGATTAAATAPVAAGVFGLRGIQEQDIALPAETAPTPAEDVDEIQPTQDQYVDEIQPTEQGFDVPEIEVTGETAVGATATEVAIGEGTTDVFGGSEIEVTGDVSPGPVESELPIGGRQTGATTGGSVGTGDSVVPSEYPQAGRDFPANPAREYVPGTGPDLTAEAQQVAGVAELLEESGEEEDEEELGPPDDPFLESDRRLYDPAREFGEQRSFREVDPTDEGLGESAEDVGSGIAGTGTGFEPARGETVAENFEQYMQARREEAERSEVLWGGGFEFPGGELEQVAAGDALAIEEVMQVAGTEAGDQAGDLPQEFTGLGEEPEMAGEATGAQEQMGDLLGEGADTQPDTVQEFGFEQPTELAQPVAQSFGNPVGFGNPTEFGYPNQFGYPNETGGNGRSRPPRTPTLPELDAESEDDRRRRGDGLAAPVVAEFADPFTGTFD